MLHRAGGIDRELQALGLEVASNQRLEARFVDRDFAARQRGHLLLIHIHADDVVAGIGKTGTGDQAHIAGAENRNAHEKSSSWAAAGGPME